MICLRLLYGKTDLTAVCGRPEQNLGMQAFSTPGRKLLRFAVPEGRRTLGFTYQTVGSTPGCLQRSFRCRNFQAKGKEKGNQRKRK